MGYREQMWRKQNEDRSDEPDLWEPELVSSGAQIGFSDWHAIAAEIEGCAEAEWPLKRFYSWCEAYERLAGAAPPSDELSKLLLNLRRFLNRQQIRDLALQIQTQAKLAKLAGALKAGSHWCPRWMARCWYLAAFAQEYAETERHVVARGLWGELCTQNAFFPTLDDVLSKSKRVVLTTHRDNTEFKFHRLDESLVRATLIERIAPTSLIGRFQRREELRALARVVTALAWRLEDLDHRAERVWVRQLWRAKAWVELRWLWGMIRPHGGESGQVNDKGDAYLDPDWQDSDDGPPVVESALLAHFAHAAVELNDKVMLKQVAWAAPRPIGDTPAASEVWGELVRAAAKLRVSGIVNNAYELVLDENRPFQHTRFGTKPTVAAFSELRSLWPEHPVVSQLNAIRAGRHVEIKHLEMVLCCAPLRDFPSRGNPGPPTEFTGAARLCGRRLINAFIEGGETGLEDELDVVVPLVRFPADWRRQLMALTEIVTQSNGVLLGAVSERCREIIEGSGFLKPAEMDDDGLFAWCRLAPDRPHKNGELDLDQAYKTLVARLTLPPTGTTPETPASRNSAALNLVVENCRRSIMGLADENGFLRYLKAVFSALEYNRLDTAGAVDVRSLLRDWVRFCLHEARFIVGKPVSTAVHTWKNRAQRRVLDHIRDASSMDDMFVRSRLHYLREDFGSVVGLVTTAGSPKREKRDLWQAIRQAVERFFPDDESPVFFPEWLQPEWSRSANLPESLWVKVWHPDKLEDAVFELLNNAYKALRRSEPSPVPGCLKIEAYRSDAGKYWEIRWRNPLPTILLRTVGTGRGGIDDDLQSFVEDSARIDSLDEPEWQRPDCFETRLYFPISKAP